MTKYWLFFMKYCYCISKPMLIHVHVKIIDSILLVSNIWYCGLNNDMGQEKLNWPKLLWYVRIIVGQVIGVTCVVSECNLCKNHMTFPQASNLPLIESTILPYICKYWKRNLSVKDRPHEGIKLIKMSTWHWLTLSYLSKHCLLWSITYHLGYLFINTIIEVGCGTIIDHKWMPHHFTHLIWYIASLWFSIININKQIITKTCTLVLLDNEDCQDKNTLYTPPLLVTYFGHISLPRWG